MAKQIKNENAEAVVEAVSKTEQFFNENGKLLASSPVFSDSLGLTITELDLGLISGERRRNTFFGKQTSDVFIKYFDLALEDTVLTRNYPVSPFVPEDISLIPARCERILDIQARGLAQRIVKAYAKKCVIGISGGLDSTLALLVVAKAFDMLGISRSRGSNLRFRKNGA